MTANKVTHIPGTFLIEASASFLNGAGLGEGEDRNVTIVKTFRDGSNRVPYVSSQSWKRWLRNTLIEETGWPASELRALHVNAKGNTDKIGGEFNPVDFPEDDIFGYMRAEKKSDDEDDDSADAKDSKKSPKGKKVKALTRSSPFSASILVSLRKTGWQGKDEAFVHLKEGTPQPYTTEFYNTNLQGIFCLNYRRLGVFSNIGDRIELDEDKAEEFMAKKKVKVIDSKESGKVYEIENANDVRKTRAAELLKSLSKLRGGAKQAAFGTDVSPKVLIVAGSTCGNPIFNNLFIDDGNGPQLKVDTLKEVVRDYADRICTPVFVGIRKGYLKNENAVSSLSGIRENGISFHICTPIEAANEISKLL